MVDIYQADWYNKCRDEVININIYQRELQQLKTWDEIQTYRIDKSWTKNYGFITTAGHGYLVVPKNDKNAKLAKKICEYGFVGELAYYLEEDSEAGAFIDQID